MIKILINLIGAILVFINILITYIYFDNKLELRYVDHYFVIKFSQFKKFYAINPSEYELENTYVRRSYKSSYRYIGFNLLDTYRYIFFYLKKNLTNKKLANDEEKKIYLSIVKEDIEELNKKAEEEIEKAKGLLNDKDRKC